MKYQRILLLTIFFFVGIVSVKNLNWGATPVGAATLNGPPPVSGKQFILLQPNTPLPSGSECANLVRRTTWEPRPENTDENQYIPIKGQDYNIKRYSGTDLGVYLPGHADAANVFLDRIDGNFQGTTDEILQWAACKWGIDEDFARAQAVVESYWDMATNGDGGDSWGLLQVRRSAHQVTYPASSKSTAFNADYTYARWRVCFEGLVDYLGENGTGYTAGDAWGCMGTWYTGNWYGTGGGGSASSAQEYINVVKGHLDARTWEQWSGVQVTQIPTPTTAGCAQKNSGDASCDNVIDLVDFEIWRKEFTGNLTTKTADFNLDGQVNITDFEIWRKGYF